MHTILVVEDKDTLGTMLKQTLEAEGYGVVLARDGEEGARMVGEAAPDLVLTDLKLPLLDGIGVLRASREENPIRPVIIMTAFGTVRTAVDAMKEGAFDFITKPFDVDHLLMLIGRALKSRRVMTENLLLKDALSSSLGLPDIIGSSDCMAGAAEQLRKAAPSKTTILLTGESGTGKELFARAIHHLSGRESYAFVPINCSAIPRDLLESELFGYEKGAFSGADAMKPGKFELAHGGTVFLDEIGEMDIGLQAKLLRFLQDSEIERVGGTKRIKLDVRIVAASNRDLLKAISDGLFREDLYYRLNVFPIRIPPLRERAGDIPLLARYFVEKYSSRSGGGLRELSSEALAALESYGWKGNVRELENTVERAIILCENNVILPEHISVPYQSEKPFPEDIPMDGSLEETARAALGMVESRRIRKALQECGGNKSRAASVLKVSYKTLLNKLKDYGIQ